MIEYVNVRCDCYIGTTNRIKVNVPDDLNKILAFGCDMECSSRCRECYKRVEEQVREIKQASER